MTSSRGGRTLPFADINTPALRYRRLRESAGSSANLASFRYVPAWTAVAAGASQTEFTSSSGGSRAGFSADLVFLAQLQHEPNIGLSVTSHKMALVPHSQVKGPH